MMNGVLLKLLLTVQLINNRLNLIQNRFELHIMDIIEFATYYCFLDCLKNPLSEACAPFKIDYHQLNVSCIQPFCA